MFQSLLDELECAVEFSFVRLRKSQSIENFRSAMFIPYPFEKSEIVLKMVNRFV